MTDSKRNFEWRPQECTIPAVRFDQEKIKRLRELESEQERIIKELEKELDEMPQVKAIREQSWNGKQRMHPQVRWVRNGFRIAFYAYVDIGPKPKPSIYIDPKVLNNLINSQILTSEEKRALLKQHLPEGVFEVGDDAGS